jgi:hypothetical protein
MTLAPASLSFASQAVSTTSPAQTITVTNTGNAALSISQIMIPPTQLTLGPQAEFVETDNCMGSSVAVGQSCSIAVRFTPAATGARSATMTIYANVSGGQATVALTGTATAAGALVLTPTSLSFPQTNVNATSAVQNITVANQGGSSVALGAATVSGDFAITANTCGATLAASTACTISIAFTPKSSGARSGTFAITGDSTTVSAALSGTGVLPATDALSPTSLSFAAQALGTTSAAQQVTLTNSGDVALTLISASATGDFAATNSCGNSLAAHASCAITVVFQPKSLGTGTGLLTVSDQYRSQTVALTGVGVAPPGVSLSPLFGVSFPATGVGLSSAPATVTLTNNGGQALAISTVSVSGDFAVVPGSNTCGSSLALGAACTMQVAFAPIAAGARTGALTVVSNAANSPQTIPLTGPGVDFALTPNGSTTVTVASGRSAVFPLLFTSGPAVAGTTVALKCSGAPVYASCKIVPETLTIDGNATTVAVTVQTGTTTAAVRGDNNIVLALLLAPVSLLALRRRRFIAAGVICLLITAAGCGAGRAIPSTGSGGGTGTGIVTPAGSYSMTVTATSSGLTRSVGLTLVVQ